MSVAELQFIDQRIWVRTPFSREFVDELKTRVPYAYRQWDPRQRAWIVDRFFEDVLIAVCKRHFGTVREVRGRSQQASFLNDSDTNDYATLHLAADAPIVVVEAAYRALCKLWHPDLSDDPDATGRMQAINSAYSRIKQARS